MKKSEIEKKIEELTKQIAELKSQLPSKHIIPQKVKRVNTHSKKSSKKPLKITGKVSDYKQVKGSSRRYENVKTHVTISRRQFMKTFKPVQYKNLLNNDLKEHAIRKQTKSILIENAKQAIKEQKRKARKPQKVKPFKLSMLRNKKEEAFLKTDPKLIGMVEYLRDGHISLKEIKDGIEMTMYRYNKDLTDDLLKSHYDIILIDMMYAKYQSVRDYYAKYPLYVQNLYDEYKYPNVSVLGEIR